MKPRVGVVVFPGSNDDRDALEALAGLGAESVSVWHGDSALPELDAVVLPGGFSYGDYLRAGAIARFSRAMQAVSEFAAEGGLVLGICNGFQVLCEAGLLPGVLRRNTSLAFVCRDVELVVERTDTPFTSGCAQGQRLVIPVKHGEGCYVPPPDLDGAVVLRYAADENPNGSADDIAGVVNDRGNVMGLMPHPEHAVDPLIGSTDGALILGSLVSEAERAREARVLGERVA
jgi:phosphoribosylformylglycinamidine synthase subunit PurQ / glutaminase